MSNGRRDGIGRFSRAIGQEPGGRLADVHEGLDAGKEASEKEKSKKKKWRQEQKQPQQRQQSTALENSKGGLKFVDNNAGSICEACGRNWGPDEHWIAMVATNEPGARAVTVRARPEGHSQLTDWSCCFKCYVV